MSKSYYREVMDEWQWQMNQVNKIQEDIVKVNEAFDNYNSNKKLVKEMKTNQIRTRVNGKIVRYEMYFAADPECIELIVFTNHNNEYPDGFDIKTFEIGKKYNIAFGIDDINSLKFNAVLFHKHQLNEACLFKFRKEI